MLSKTTVLAAIAAMFTIAHGPAAAKAPKGEAGAKQGWQAIAVSEWKVPVAADIMDIVAPAYQGFPESAEGRQRLSVELARSGDGFTATVTKQGLLDDSVGAEQMRLDIQQRDANWHLTRAARRWQCRRGATAGRWTARPCS